MSKYVFILGAGASASAGAPLMNNFLSIARDLFGAGQAGCPDDYSNVLQTIGRMQALHSKAKVDLYNLETVFTIFEFVETIGRGPGIESANEARELVDSFKRMVVDVLQRSMEFKFDFAERKGSDYWQFANLCKGLAKKSSRSVEAVSVLTFNYDIGIDLALNDTGCTYDCVVPRVSVTSPPKPEVHLFKLHGSVNWAKDKEGIKAIDPHTMFRLFSQLAQGSNIWIECDKLFDRLVKDCEPAPFIVPPTWNKAVYHRQISQVWEAAAKELQDAEYVYVMGYSLPETDAFFRHLYALGCCSNVPFRKFIVFDPDKAVGERFESMLGTGAAAVFQYEERKFDDAIDYLKFNLKIRGVPVDR